MTDTAPELLVPFGLRSSIDPRFVFESELTRAAEHIRGLYRNLDFDHRSLLPERDQRHPFLMCEEFRRGYACFKYAVSRALTPQSICEIGVGAGTGAHAFLAASPKAHYIGIDNGSKGQEDGFDFLSYVRDSLTSRGYSFEIRIHDSLSLDRLPTVDLIHIDGNHQYEGAYNDTRLAILSGSEWILIDDSRDFHVSAGALTAVNDFGYGLFEWMAFEDTWTGSILLRRLL